MKRSDYLTAKKEVAVKLKRNGIDVNQLDPKELEELVAEHVEEKESANEMRIALSLIGLCFGLWI